MNNTNTEYLNTTETGTIPAFENGQNKLLINGWPIDTDTSTHTQLQAARVQRMGKGESIDTYYGGFTESPTSKIELIRMVLDQYPISHIHGLSVLGVGWPIVFISELAPDKWDSIDINPFEIEPFTRNHNPAAYNNLNLHYGDILNLQDEYFEENFSEANIIDLSNIPDILSSIKFGTGDFSRLEHLIIQILSLTKSGRILLTFSAKTDEVGKRWLAQLKQTYPEYSFVLEQKHDSIDKESYWREYGVANLIQFQNCIVIEKPSKTDVLS